MNSQLIPQAQLAAAARRPQLPRRGRLAAELAALEPSRSLTIALALLLTLAAAFGDAETSAPTTFTLFYVVALGLGTWFGGLGVGYATAAVALAGGATASFLTEPRVPSAWFIAWNAALDGALYVGCVHVLWALKRRLDHERVAREDALGQLRHAERLTTLGKLASGVAHEIGTPLNVILGRAELIAFGSQEPEAIRKSAEVILAQAERVAGIIRQLLNFARRGAASVARTDLTDLVETTALMLAPIAAKSGVHISYSGAHVEANVNGSEIQQVVTNLLTNAIHAMPDGGSVEIETRRERTHAPGRRGTPEASYAVVQVRDHGTGIEPDVFPRIFDPFFTTKEIGRGTGLGLSVAFGIVQDHRGWIAMDTRLGEGTTATVYLPQQ